MPNVVSLDVRISSGWAAGRLAIAARVAATVLSRSRCLCEDDLVAHRSLVEFIHYGEVIGLGAMPRIDENVDAAKVRPAGEVGVDQLRPRRDLVLRRLRETIAGHVDDPERRVFRLEDVELLRASGRVRCTRQRYPAGH